MRKVIITLATVATLALAGTAAADTGGTLAGGATQANGIVTLTSNATTPSSSVVFALPDGTTFADLKTLSTNYDITAGGCGGGSPRFELTLADGNHVYAYIGPAPNFTGCPLNAWQSSGNLIGNNTAGVWDTSKEIPGTQVSTYSAALAAIGSMQVKSVALVVDSGWMFGTQTVLAKNITVNGTTFPAPSSKSPAQACKAEQRANPAAFKAKYGTNHNKSNAFGKCVSAKAKAKSHTS